MGCVHGRMAFWWDCKMGIGIGIEMYELFLGRFWEKLGLHLGYVVTNVSIE